MQRFGPNLPQSKHGLSTNLDAVTGPLIRRSVPTMVNRAAAGYSVLRQVFVRFRAQPRRRGTCCSPCLQHPVVHLSGTNRPCFLYRHVLLGVQTWDDGVGIEDDSHGREELTSARYSSTRPATSSGPMPLSLALSSPYWSSCLHSHSSMYRSSASRRNSLLDRPCCFIASSTRSANSGGKEKVMVLVVRGVLTPRYRALLLHCALSEFSVNYLVPSTEWP